MAFPQKPQYKDIREKLDAETDQHNGYGWADFDKLARLHEKNPARLGFSTLAYLMSVGSTNTVKSWLQQRKEVKR